MPQLHPEEQNSEDKPDPEADPKAEQPDPDEEKDQVDYKCPYVPQLRKGHPLVCHLPGSKCTCAVRMLRAAVVHYSQLSHFQRLVTTARVARRTILDVDSGVANRDYNLLLKACKLTFETLFKAHDKPVGQSKNTFYLRHTYW